MAEDYKPRFSFEISEEQKQRADKLLANYGMRKSLFGPILDDVLDLIDEFGMIVYGAILSHAAKPRDIIPALKVAEEKGKQSG